MMIVVVMVVVKIVMVVVVMRDNGDRCSGGNENIYERWIISDDAINDGDGDADVKDSDGGGNERYW